MTSDPSNPHDALMRRLLSDPDDAAAEIRLIVPKDIEKSLDWDTTKRVDGSFVSAELRAQYSDLLFRTRLTREPREAFVYLLIEHQSTPDPLMAFRILEYQVSIIRKHLRDCAKRGQKVERVPAVLPMVVHAGPKGARWNAPLEVGELFDLDPATHTAMCDHLPRMRYLLDDVNAIDAPALLARPGTPRTRMSMVLVKTTGRGREVLPHILPDLVQDISSILAGPNGREDFQALVTYIEKLSELLPDELEAFADQLGPLAKEILMTTAEMYRAQGEAHGRAEGEARARAATLLELLTDKFGTPDPSIEQRVHAADVEQLKVWFRRAMKAESLDEVLV